MGRSYKLYATSTTTANAAASLRVTKAARIRCILFASVGQAGAAVDGYFVVEVSKQSVSSYGVNDTPETVLSTFIASLPISGGGYGAQASTVCDLPVSVGDTLYLNVTRGGTAPVVAHHEITMFTD